MGKFRFLKEAWRWLGEKKEWILSCFQLPPEFGAIIGGLHLPDGCSPEDQGRAKRWVQSLLRPCILSKCGRSVDDQGSWGSLRRLIDFDDFQQILESR